MTPSLLQKKFNALLTTDTRPLGQRDLHQKRHGRKRTNLDAVRILTAPTGTASSTAPNIKSLTQSSIANAGNTILGTLTAGPLLPAAINQNVLSDCWLLVAALLVLFPQPSFFDDLIVPISPTQVVVQLYSNGLIVQITTSLLISTDYNRPANGDIRIELLEKAYALFRAGVSDYLQLNLGVVASALAAFGLDATSTSVNATTLATALHANKVVGLGTTATAPSPWVQDHAYAIRTTDPAGNFILRNPWAGAVDLDPLPPTSINDPIIFNAAHIGSFPANKRLLSTYVPKASVATVAALQAATQEISTMTTLSVTQPTTLPISAAALFDCKPEAQGGRPDIGYLLSDGYAEFALSLPAAATVTLTIPIAALTAGQLLLSTNGAPAATLPFPATGSWSTFTTITAQLPLPAGPITLRLSPVNAAQYNLADMTITSVVPPRQMKTLAIDFDAHTATATYQDGTTALLV